MLTYSLDNIGNKSIYEYLYMCIKNDILEGKLKVDEQLPSKRALASNLGISILTVENSYAQLMSEGYIYSLPKKGFYVSDISGITRLRPVKHEIKKNSIPEHKEKIYDISSNKNAEDSFPFSIWAKLMRKAMSENKEELMRVTPSAGALELREAIANHLASFRNMDVQPNQIIIGAGTEYLYGLLIQLLGRDKKYCLENPGYSKIAKIYKNNNVEFSYADMDEDGVTLKSICECNTDVLHICPTHHFPTGITMPVSRRFELLSWAGESKDRYIIEDDYDAEFRMTGRVIPAMQSIDISEKVIYINTFSKTLTPTIRISYMVLPAHLANEFHKKLNFYACTVSNFEQLTLAHFIDEGFFEKHLNRMRIVYQKKRKQLLDILKDSKKYLDVSESDSGLHLLIRLKTDISDLTIKEELARENININSLSEYYHDEQKRDEHMFVVSYSDLDVEKFTIALKLIISIIK